MATLGVVNFSDKISVLQQSSLENYSDQSNKRQIIFLRTNPNTTQSNSDNPLTNSSIVSTKKTTITGTTAANKPMTRIHNPPPVAVARRNARERNRVKQVNNGFATLRQHIPTNIAAAFESGNGRGSNKKLSKVETLRMAVEYIKSLEKLLNLTDDNATNNNTTSSVINYSTSSISPNSSHFNSTYAYSTGTDDDDDIRSPRNLKNNNFQLLYEDEENIHPLKMEQMEDHLLQGSHLAGDLELTDSHDMALLNSIDNNTSLSPEVYSEHSLSPGALDHNTKSFHIPVFNNQNLLPSFSQIAYDKLPHVKSELLSPSGPQTHYDDDLQKSESQRVCIITRNEVINEHDSVIDVMWWEQAQQQH